MLPRFVLAFVFAVSASMASAQSDDELRAAATRYVENPVQQQMLDDMLSPEAMVAQMQAMAPQLPDDALQVISQIASEELALLRPALEAAMIEGAVAAFTLEEIEALEAFYNTDLGASVMGKMQGYMATAMAAIGPEMAQMQGRVAQRVGEALSNP